METPSNLLTSEITNSARKSIADGFDVSLDAVYVQGVEGGYSRNRRSLVNVADTWLFAKEVDVELLPNQGEEELWWLKKDYLLTEKLRKTVPHLVPEYAELDDTGHLLTMTAYRPEDGWYWTLPEDSEQQNRYIDTVVTATRELEQVLFSDDEIKALKLQPFLRDELALDGGVDMILQNETIRKQLIAKYTAIISNHDSLLHRQCQQMIELLNDDYALRELSAIGKQLINQPNDSFGHCDVRSDNVAVRPESGEVKLVDWNWASFTPKGFGSNEFLADMARRGVDISPWASELNAEILAATVGYYAKRCLRDPYTPGSTLRDMQTETAAVVYDLFKMVK